MALLEKQINGYEVKGLAWKIAKPTANVIILEGMEEHSSRYDYFAKKLNEAHYSVFCLDAFGQGENTHKDDPKTYGIWPDNGFSEFVKVIVSFAEELGKDGLPLYIFSHSMGSFMGQYLIQYYPSVASKVVLCGCGTKKGILGLGHAVAKIVTNKKNKHEKAKLLNNLMFGNFNNKIKNPRTPFDWLSYNEENVDKYIADPLCGYGPNNGFCLEFIKGMLALNKKDNLNNLNKDAKLFLISGQEDPVSDYGEAVIKLKELYTKHGIKEVTCKLYNHARHEILNEDIKDEVIKDIINFFNN